MASTLSALSPAFARLRFVRATSSASESALNVPPSQASVRAGMTNVATDVDANRSATASATRRDAEPRSTTRRTVRRACGGGGKRMRSRAPRTSPCGVPGTPVTIGATRRRFRSAMVRVSAVRWYQRVRSGQGWMADIWCGLGQYRQAPPHLHDDSRALRRDTIPTWVTRPPLRSRSPDAPSDAPAPSALPAILPSLVPLTRARVRHARASAVALAQW